jgi:phage terminase small subunit
LDKLTEKQKKFIDYYVETGNATEAARRAGYEANSEKAMRNIGSENLAKLGTFIDERLKPDEDKRIADANEVLQYLTAVCVVKSKIHSILTHQ